MKSAQGTEKGRSTFVLSGIMIAMSFLAMIVPLAMYHVAQVGAAVGRRQSASLLFLVITFLCLLGLLWNQQIFLLSGITGLAWMPAFLIGVAQRARGRRSGLVATSFVMFLVPIASLLLVLLPSQVADFGLYLESLKNELQQAGLGTLGTEASLQATQMEHALTAFSKSSEFSVIKSLFESPWHARLIWMLYGKGTPWLFGLLLMALGNLVLLDMAFEQVERIRVIARYVESRPESFRESFRTALGNLKASLKAEGNCEGFEIATVRQAGMREPTVQNHAQKSNGNSPKFMENLFEKLSEMLSFLVKPKGRLSEVTVLGMTFTLRRRLDYGAAPETSTGLGWNLKAFRLPLVLGLLSIAAFLASGFAQRVLNERGGLVDLASGRFDGFWALLGLAGFVGCGLLAAQGMIVALQRLTPVGLFVGLFSLLFLGGWVALNPLILIAFFGSIGLLDQLYDFRSLGSARNLPAK